MHEILGIWKYTYLPEEELYSPWNVASVVMFKAGRQNKAKTEKNIPETCASIWHYWQPVTPCQHKKDNNWRLLMCVHMLGWQQEPWILTTVLLYYTITLTYIYANNWIAVNISTTRWWIREGTGRWPTSFVCGDWYGPECCLDRLAVRVNYLTMLCLLGYLSTDHHHHPQFKRVPLPSSR